MTNDLRNARDWAALFCRMHSGFFEQPHIRALPEDGVWEEMALDLSGFSADAVKIPVPEGITFGLYRGEIEPLREVVRQVDESWPVIFRPGWRVYCAFDGGQVASFCLLEDMGTYDGLRVGGPGCVGTLPAWRRRGIGLKMVQNATEILKREGFDLSYIHFTGVADWYARLGYRTVLRWSKTGIIGP